MENTHPNLELRSTSIFSKKADEDDKILQCNAYLSTKLFMAKRIADQQKEIETLKEQLIYHTTRHTELYDVLKNINEQLATYQTKLLKRAEHQESEKLNLSGDLANSFTFEGGEEDNKEKPPKEKLGTEDEKDKIIESLKSENLTLRKELEILKTDSLDKIFFNNKLVYEKFIVLTELNELTHCLKRVDLNLLNKFYIAKTNVNDFTEQNENIFEFSKSNINSPEFYNTISSMGIKYNILSAQSQITLLMNSAVKEGEIVSNQLNQTENKFEKTAKSFMNVSESQSRPSVLENLEKCCGILNSYEEELNSYVYDLKNVKRPLGFPKNRSESY
jgi:hypothetical protein